MIFLRLLNKGLSLYLWIAISIFSVIGLGRCASEAEEDSRSHKKNATNSDDAFAKQGDKQSDTPEGENPNGGDNTPGDDDATGDDDDQPGANLTSSAFFDQKLYSKLLDKCSSCHAGPFVEVDPKGPMTIFDYEQMVNMIADNPELEKSYLHKKLSNIEPHSGGNICLEDFEGSICDLVAKWQIILLKEDRIPELGQQPGNALVTIDYVGSLGDYSIRLGNGITEGVNYEIEVVRDIDSAGEILVNTITVDARFRYSGTIDQNNIDNNQHNLTAILIADGQAEATSETLTYTAYKPSDAAFYENTLRPMLNNCNGCHGTRSLTSAFYNLVTPAPEGGGSATNNTLYLKSSGGANHGGGNRCGGNNICQTISEWWQREFQ